MSSVVADSSIQEAPSRVHDAFEWIRSERIGTWWSRNTGTR